jgi:hypothetical protein
LIPRLIFKAQRHGLGEWRGADHAEKTHDAMAAWRSAGLMRMIAGHRRKRQNRAHSARFP